MFHQITLYNLDENDERRICHQKSAANIFPSASLNILSKNEIKYPAILLIHANDFKYCLPKYRVKVLNALKSGQALVIAYSGGGESCVEEVFQEFQIELNAQICIVGRAVDKYQPLSATEIDRICQEIDFQDTKLSFRNPDCLRQPIDNLCALSCLCQAYLLTHTALHQSIVTIAALNVLGWKTWSTSNAGQTIATHLTSQAHITEQPRWWQHVLQGSSITPTLTTLQTEWGTNPLPPSIKTLLDRIDRSSVLDNSDLIAQAFLDLSHRFDLPRQPETTTEPWYNPHLDTLIPIRHLLKRFRLTHSTPKNRAIFAVLMLLQETTSAPSHPQPYLMDATPEPDDELLILLIDQSTPTTTVINRIKHLRFHQKWSGAILTIAPPVTVNKLDRWSLFSLQNPIDDTKHKVSQLCLSRPVLITEGLSALSWLIPYDAPALELTCQALSPGSDSPTQNIWRLWERIESDADASSHSIITEIVQIILQHEESIFTFLIEHNDFGLIKKFHRDPDSVTNADVSALIRRVMDKLQKWTLPASPQNDESPCRRR